MNLPQPIETYFNADSRNDADAMLQAFGTDAVVRDEGKTHRGCQAIEAWWRAAKAQYQHVAEPLECTKEREEYRVRARVTGNFPGSPAVLTFAFRLEHNWIARLEITA
ncbi:nuclear transport factor 2 family protein [Amorphus sp. 3PC139-8]|uniref:nuclear transport factor 2 family protein n=1 Tax=Amorphus sp. 3PC139-8 TaxID=2735676 RepID=UPI00345C8ECA